MDVYRLMEPNYAGKSIEKLRKFGIFALDYQDTSGKVITLPLLFSIGTVPGEIYHPRE